ncbi:hypothetical protein Bpfe_005027 [Biomphalaria pfeifferi]|uniref:Uncharacterized protein n=1 Tax=Biomphalaria pfeifferi TaxID=112525 RepID=A0AAD8C336_BIOPF|nr:hypothetical protein Bpfe_005027 [Biomphalaria pfeifferi]
MPDYKKPISTASESLGKSIRAETECQLMSGNKCCQIWAKSGKRVNVHLGINEIYALMGMGLSTLNWEMAVA